MSHLAEMGNNIIDTEFIIEVPTEWHGISHIIKFSHISKYSIERSETK